MQRLSRLITITLLTYTSVAMPSAAQVADVLSFMLSTTENSDSVAPKSGLNATAGVLDVIMRSNPSASVGSLDYIARAFTPAPNTTLPAHKGSIYTPRWGRITSGFGFRRSFGRVHQGIDVSMSVGDTVCAPLPGRIDKIGYEAKGYGHYVVMVHDNGMETRYAHLSQILVSAGQNVTTGEPIALSGSTGNSTGPHLHFETRQMGIAVDPRTVFDFNNGGSYNIASANTSKNASKKSTYIVRQGDTVSKIAKKVGITALRLCQLNFITEDSSLSPGTMLKLR